jgi:hypothetical protein
VEGHKCMRVFLLLARSSYGIIQLANDFLVNGLWFSHLSKSQKIASTFRTSFSFSLHLLL